MIWDWQWLCIKQVKKNGYLCKRMSSASASLCHPPLRTPPVRLGTQEDLTRCRNSNFSLFPLCVCDTVIEAVCLPSAIKSNRPSSPADVHSKKRWWWLTGAVGARRTHRRTKTTAWICLSQRGRAAWLRVRSQLGLHYASKHVCAHECWGEEGDGFCSDLTWVFCSCSRSPPPMSVAFVSCFSPDRIWPCSREIRSLTLLVIKQYFHNVGMNTHRHAYIYTYHY